MARGSKIRRVYRAFGQLAREEGNRNRVKGIETEEKVSNVLKNMKDKGLIERWWRSLRLSGPDKRGVDFCLVFSEWGEEIRLQIKSSKKGAEKHIKKAPHIPVIVIQEADDPETIKNKILQLRAILQSSSKIKNPIVIL